MSIVSRFMLREKPILTCRPPGKKYSVLFYLNKEDAKVAAIKTGRLCSVVFCKNCLGYHVRLTKRK